MSLSLYIILSLLSIHTAYSQGDLQLHLACYSYDGLTMFDYSDLNSPQKDYMYQFTAYNASSQPIFSDIYVFNFCQATEQQCTPNQNVWAYKVHYNHETNTTSCASLSGNDLMESYKYETVTNQEAQNRHAKLTYYNGDICPYSMDGTTRYQFTIELQCKEDSGEALSIPVVNLNDRCHPVFTYETKHGCAVFSATPWIRYIRNQPYVLGALLILFGLLSTFKGKQLFEVTVGILGGGVVFLISMLFFSYMKWLDYLDDFHGHDFLTALSAFLLAAVIALIAGYLLARAGWLICVMSLGVIGGYFLGISIYNLVFFASNALWLYLLLSFGGAFLGGYMAYTCHEQIMILGTAFIGAYSLIRGISLFGGNFPNEALLYSQIQQGITPYITWDFFAYLVGIVVIFVIGSVYQMQHRHNNYQYHYKERLLYD